MEWEKVGQRIKEERKKYRLTQEKLAEEAGLNDSYIGQIERGSKKPSMESIVKLANTLGITVDYLLQDVVPAKKNALLEEVLAELSKRDDEEIRLILNMIRLMGDFLEKRKDPY